MDDDNFINMGYAVICDNCDRRHSFPESENVDELKEDMDRKGLFTVEGKHYCSKDCYKESIGTICLHVYSRDNDRNCVKCGVPEVVKCCNCGEVGSVFCGDRCEAEFYRRDS